MPIVLLLVAIAIVAYVAFKALPRAGSAHDAHGESLSLEHHPGTIDLMTIEERVEIGAIIDDWIDVGPAMTIESRRAAEDAIIERCDAMLAALDDREGNADVDTATRVLRSVLAMALLASSQFRNCVEVLREQPVPESLLEPQDLALHPFPVMMRALVALGEYDEALLILDADARLDDRRDPDSAVLAAAERDQQRALIALNRGEYEQARPVLEREAHADDTHGDATGRAWMLAAMAHLDQETGDLDRAWDEATTVRRDLAALGAGRGDPVASTAAATETILARVELARGDAAAARERADAARTKLTRHVPDVWVETTLVVAAAARALGVLDEALAEATDALALATDIEAAHCMAQAEEELGEIHLARGDRANAVAALEAARARFDAMSCGAHVERLDARLASLPS